MPSLILPCLKHGLVGLSPTVIYKCEIGEGRDSLSFAAPVYIYSHEQERENVNMPLRKSVLISIV